MIDGSTDAGDTGGLRTVLEEFNKFSEDDVGFPEIGKFQQNIHYLQTLSLVQKQAEQNVD